MKEARFARQALLVFAAALAVRAVHVWQMRRSPFFDTLLGDSRGYDIWARQIAGGDWLGTDVFYQAPLYPYFLGLIYAINGNLAVVRVCQAIIGAGSCVLLASAARQLFGNAVGLVAGLMLAFYAPAVFFDGLVQKPVLEIFFLCLVLDLLSGIVTCPERLWRWLGVGLALGALSLTRENALLFVPVVLGWIWLHWRPLGATRLRLAAALLVGLAIVLLPVGLRNRLVGGEFHLTTAQSGTNFYIGNNPQADGTYKSLRFGRGSPEYERLDATELAEKATGRALSPGEVSRFWTERALAYIRTQPLDWAALLWRKFRLLCNVAEVVDTESQESHADWSSLLRILSPVAHFGVLAPLALIGIWITWGERRRLGLLYAMLGVYALSVLAFYVVGRYRLSLVPFLIVFASAAVVRGRRFLSARSPAEIGTAAGLVAAVTIFCNWPVVSRDLMRAVTYHNLGTALQSDGRSDDAVRAYERALGLRPDYAPSHNNLGAVLREQGKLDEAIGHLEKALRLGPDFVEAAYNLANAFTAKGKLDEAVERYRSVLQLTPDAVDARSNLGIALASQGQLDEATEQFRKAVALAPQTADPHYNLGSALLTRGSVLEAIEHLSQAIQIDPAHVSARYELANAYLAQERFEQAAEQYREAIRLSPKFVEAHNNLGIALGSMGQLNEAIEQFRAALQIDPSYGEAQANLQKVLARAASAR